MAISRNDTFSKIVRVLIGRGEIDSWNGVARGIGRVLPKKPPYVQKRGNSVKEVAVTVVSRSVEHAVQWRRLLLRLPGDLCNVLLGLESCAVIMIVMDNEW
ncbi:hypothetical protein KPH14_011336 [Odynerus spinipes]|uniref:Uncharacterized protein n=1 Tax=Odynerus spinipes TaxID=1348599 RepID=A0AAD9RJB6_9HYME|nr:hypothetical protein KPH14_011336 [Odynerus spinipes]